MWSLALGVGVDLKAWLVNSTSVVVTTVRTQPASGTLCFSSGNQAPAAGFTLLAFCSPTYDLNGPDRYLISILNWKGPSLHTDTLKRLKVM